MGLNAMHKELGNLLNMSAVSSGAFPEGKKNDDRLCSFKCTRNYSQLSSSSTMSQTSTPTIVYQRRKQNKNSVATCSKQPWISTKPSDGSHSALSSEAPSVAAQEHAVSVSEDAAEALVMHPVECNTEVARSFNGCPPSGGAGCKESLISDVDRVLNVCCANDNCSSSKSNLELSSASLKIDTDDAGECSSSGALVAEKFPDEMSERDICISILRNHGLLDRVYTRKGRVSAKNNGIISDNYCSKSCKVCEHLEHTSNLLICDNCEEAFHISCCNPPVPRIPVGEWLCNSCLKKKHKILKEKSTSTSVNLSTETGNGYSVSEGELGSLEFMFRDTEPYMSNVRIGDRFQANVPNWSGPLDDSSHLIGDPLKMHPSKDIAMQECDPGKPQKFSSIGNWLQCQEVIEDIGQGVDGTICGKWRRAPLFEVQTDDWECFCCMRWDPAHADCAAPQELETEEVMKQLKYVEMLRPRLAAKRRKLHCLKTIGAKDPADLRLEQKVVVGKRCQTAK